MSCTRFSRVLMVSLALALGVCGIASAAQRGVLRKAEYQQLRTAEKRIKSLSAEDPHSVTRVASICKRLHSVSPLIGAVRTGCLDLITLSGDRAKLNAAATKCGIDPGSVGGLLTCMVAPVRSYYGDAEAFYLAESRVNRIATARGFGPACVAVIGDSQRNIAAEGQLAADLKTAVTALQNQDPNALQSLTANISHDVNSIRPGPSSLSLCPHAASK